MSSTILHLILVVMSFLLQQLASLLPASVEAGQHPYHSKPDTDSNSLPPSDTGSDSPLLSSLATTNASISSDAEPIFVPDGGLADVDYLGTPRFSTPDFDHPPPPQPSGFAAWSESLRNSSFSTSDRLAEDHEEYNPTEFRFLASSTLPTISVPVEQSPFGNFTASTEPSAVVSPPPPLDLPQFAPQFPEVDFEELEQALAYHEARLGIVPPSVVPDAPFSHPATSFPGVLNTSPVPINARIAGDDPSASSILVPNNAIANLQVAPPPLPSVDEVHGLKLPRTHGRGEVASSRNIYQAPHHQAPTGAYDMTYRHPSSEHPAMSSTSLGKRKDPITEFPTVVDSKRIRLMARQLPHHPARKLYEMTPSSGIPESPCLPSTYSQEIHHYPPANTYSPAPEIQVEKPRAPDVDSLRRTPVKLECEETDLILSYPPWSSREMLMLPSPDSYEVPAMSCMSLGERKAAGTEFPTDKRASIMTGHIPSSGVPEAPRLPFTSPHEILRYPPENTYPPAPRIKREKRKASGIKREASDVDSLGSLGPALTRRKYEETALMPSYPPGSSHEMHLLPSPNLYGVPSGSLANVYEIYGYPPTATYTSMPSNSGGKRKAYDSDSLDPERDQKRQRTEAPPPMQANEASGSQSLPISSRHEHPEPEASTSSASQVPFGGDNKFACPMCRKRFSEAGNYRRHSLHSCKGRPNVQNERIANAHQCPTCHKQFSRRDSLKRHCNQSKGKCPCPAPPLRRVNNAHPVNIDNLTPLSPSDLHHDFDL